MVKHDSHRFHIRSGPRVRRYPFAFFFLAEEKLRMTSPQVAIQANPTVRLHPFSHRIFEFRSGPLPQMLAEV